MKKIKPIFFIPHILFSVVFLFNILFSNKCFFMRDISGQFYPWKTFIKEALISGEFPVYNPYNFCGSQFFTNLQSGIFYPFACVFNLFNFPVAYKFYILIHLILMGTFSFLLFRYLNLSLISSYFGSFIFMFNSSFITQFEFLSGTGTYIWIPVLFLFSISCSKKTDNFFNILIFALSISFSFLSGQPQILFLWFMISLLYIFFYFKKTEKKHLLIKFFISCFLALLISTVQFLPSINFFLNSSRLEYSLKDINILSLNFKELLRFIIPFSGIENITNIPLSIQLYNENFWVKTFFIGIIPFLLSILSLFSVYKKRVKIFFLLILLSIFLSLGENNPFYHFYYNYFPFLKFVRYPSRYILISLFSIIILSAFGFEFLKIKLTQNKLSTKFPD